ncbi:MAG TPA: hypothetical protein VNU22_08680, partial [Candidatus Acidoferrum sp.]|nr:hypothetical protein [Candidatus Acidoferrum sp.]HXB83404.1 hypothetical protein [Candidatus Acidoferrum sp.]
MKSRLAGVVVTLFAMTACGGSGSGSSSMPPAANGMARVRFADGAPALETVIGGTPQTLCLGANAPCYLQVNGETVSELFYYGTMTSFVNV